jgi:hypothetical protein
LTTHSVFQTLVSLFGNILGGAPSAYHVQFKPHSSTAALSVTSALTIEIVTMWFPTSYSKKEMNKAAESAEILLVVFEKEAENYRGGATGWVHEDINIPGTDDKGKAFVMLLGWTSVKAHEDFTNTQAFKDNIHHVMSVKDLRKIEAVHTSLTEVAGKKKLTECL